ncbi:retron system putative HNH endonuclease [Alkalinema sp. FACHB-956]|uniref:retron system putative HNH endonuclease n=1 Tax=Alkalinema sp. FACHB-956 TaxID=2692768 RepID=UPI001682F3FE|nr:retron system putative HNH endonuclease [Alkalinema sp. FACHB-956]MBD2326334.1 TIGR02646 family protein [Alkalinema sp. FACHB-956]
MRFIQKQSEPAEFSQWKQKANDDWQPTWENFQKPEKAIVHQALIAEQGHICCYCGQRITPTNSHIEHFQPRTLYPDLHLRYTNLLASCPGYPEAETPQPKQIHRPLQEFCGQQKGAWYDPHRTVSPLQPDCTTYFRYTASGEILPTQDTSKADAAQTTIEKLRLDHIKLNNQRKAAIDGALVDFETLTTEDIQKLIEGYDRPNSSGQYSPFCTAVIYTLQQFI